MLISKNIILLGDDASRKKYRDMHPNYSYFQNINIENVDISSAVFVVTGDSWKKEAEILELKGYKFGENIFSDWYDELIHEDKYCSFEEIKKYVKKDVDKVADVFEYTSKIKKIAVVYGNCQSMYLSALLQRTKLSEEYIFCMLPWIQNIVDEKVSGFDSRYMSKISLFVYQIAKLDNAFGENLSTDLILPLLNENCIKVSVPFVYFNAYFPQYIKNKRNDDTRRGKGHVPYGDKLIQEYLENGYGIQKTAILLGKEDLYTKEQVLENYEITIKELEKREEQCDVKILDYLVENYQNQYLFYSPSHPTNLCLIEVVNRVLEYIGMAKEELSVFEGVEENDSAEMYIYPSVKKNLGLNFERKKFCLYRDNSNTPLQSIEEYVQEYAKYCFPELNEDTLKQFRSINIAHMLQINESVVKERRAGVLVISGCAIQCSLYLTVIAKKLRVHFF